MPVGPRGEQLPYEGEPGYEEAKAQYPEIYAEEEGMPPGGGMEMAPGDDMAMDMPPGEGMPMEAGPEAGAAVDEEGMARMEAVAAAAPTPEKPYSIKVIEKLVDELNAFADKAFGEGSVPEIEFDSGGEQKWSQPLPAPVFVPLAAVSDLASGINEKYSFEVSELLSDAELRAASGKVRQMHSDKEFMEMATAVPEDEAPGDMDAEEPEAMPGEMSPEDEELMAAM